MTKSEFKILVDAVTNEYDIGKSGESDLETAQWVRPFDPKLASLVEDVANAKIALRAYLTTKVER